MLNAVGPMINWVKPNPLQLCSKANSFVFSGVYSQGGMFGMAPLIFCGFYRKGGMPSTCEDQFIKLNTDWQQQLLSLS